MELVWNGSADAEENRIAFGRADQPSCWMLAGYASGYATFVLGRNCYFIERKCHAAGDRTCSAVGKDADSWGDELKPHLPYYQADDIQGKVLNLTRELQRKTRELAEQRRQLRQFKHEGREPLLRGAQPRRSSRWWRWRRAWRGSIRRSSSAARPASARN